MEEWGCRFGRLALTTIDSSFIKDHRSVLVRLQHAERIHRTILGVDIPATISLLIAGEFRSHEFTSCPSKDSSRIVRHHDWEASNPSRNQDRKRVVKGKSVSVRVDLVGGRIIKK